MTVCHGTSVEPVVIKDIHITKSTNGEDKGSAKGKSSDTMGSKSIVEQGLYVVKGSVNPFYADKNGVSHEDVEVLKKALATIFEMMSPAPGRPVPWRYAGCTGLNSRRTMPVCRFTIFLTCWTYKTRAAGMSAA